MGTNPLTKLEVKKLIYSWFKMLTDHEPIEKMLEMLNVDSLEMIFPGATLKSEGDFRTWYQTVTNTYFDQVHELKMLDIQLNGGQADVNLVVNWQARSWERPTGYSKWVGVYAHQTWAVKRNPKTNLPAISRYEVQKFEPMDGPLKIS